MQMLFDGELDAVLGEKSDDPRAKQLFPDIATEEKAWLARHGVVPINHMVVVSKQLSDTQPDVVREVHRMLQASRAAAKGKVPAFTADEMTRSLALITDYSAQQGLIPRAYTVDDLFDDVTRSLR